MVIIHIVLFEFKPTTTHEQVQEVGICPVYYCWLYLIYKQACDRMLVLREKCVHPTTKSTYIKSAVGGRDNSPEGHQVPHSPRLTALWNSKC